MPIEIITTRDVGAIHLDLSRRIGDLGVDYQKDKDAPSCRIYPDFGALAVEAGTKGLKVGGPKREEGNDASTKTNPTDVVIYPVYENDVLVGELLTTVSL